MSDPMALLNTALEGRYRLERELGEGGMATVYLAHDDRHDRRVAIKVLKPALAAAVGSDRFLAEIRTTANLQHPHILPLYDSGEADGFLYYVMPYVEGETLRERLDRETRLSVEEAIRIVRAVAGAVHYAHEQGVIHRDIKPENVLLQSGEPLVADFGIALAVHEAGGARLTETGLALGTPHYMSPEQATGESEPGPASDIYSLGCVLYELLTGEPPHRGATVQATIARLLVEEPTRPRTLRKTISDSLDAAIMKALAKVHADRYPSAELFASALEDGATAEPSGPARRHHPVEKTYPLTADICRGIDRADLDPRMIGDHLRFLDNEVESDVLVVCLHGIGGDPSSFLDVLETTAFRGIAPGLYGFEPQAERRAALSLGSHEVLIRRFLSDCRTSIDPKLTVVVGFSSGADLFFRIISSDENIGTDVDGFLALGSNVSADTCFVTRALGRLEPGGGSEILPELVATAAGARTLGEWLNTHEYLVTVLRKFQSDFRPLRRHGLEISEPFLEGDSPFPVWFRAATERLGVLRCVFADTEIERTGIQQVLFEHLDTGILGDGYREECVSIERGADHFDLVSPECINGHVAEIVETLRRP